MSAAVAAQLNPPLTAAERAARSVFVGNIPYEATEEQLKDIFAQVGPVVSFRLVYDRETGKPKGYGFCEYQDIETAQSAMRNLNNHDFNGRPLRVGVAAGEQNKDEMKSMQQAVGGAPVESPFGDPVEPEKAPEAISRAVASLPPEQMFELMKQMKLCIQNNPNEARNMLLQNPQLAYALLQAQIVMKIVDPQVAMAMLHRQTEAIPPLLPSQTNNGAGPDKGMDVKNPMGGMPPSSMGPPSSMPMSMAQQSMPAMSTPTSMAPPTSMGSPDFGRGGPSMLNPGNLLGDLQNRAGPMGGAPPRQFDPRGPGMNDMNMSSRDLDMRRDMGGPRDLPRDMGPQRDMGGLRDMGLQRDMGGPPRDMGGPPRDMGGPPRDMGGPRDMRGPRDMGGMPDLGGHRDMGGPMGGPRDMGRPGMPGQRPGMGGPPDMNPRGPPPRDMRDPRAMGDPHGMPQRGMGGGPPDHRPDPRNMGSDRDMRGSDPRGMDPRGPVRGPPPADLGRGPAAGPPRPPPGGLGGLGALGGLAGGPAGAGQDKEKAALIMQVLQLSDQQIAMLPPDQRQSILILKEQISRSTAPT